MFTDVKVVFNWIEFSSSFLLLFLSIKIKTKSNPLLFFTLCVGIGGGVDLHMYVDG